MVLLATGCRGAARPAGTALSTSSAAAPQTTGGSGGSTAVPASLTPAASSPPLPSSSLAPPSASAPCGQTTEPPATYRHVVWIWMENHTWSQVLGDPNAAPYEVTLAARCATATNYRSVGSPSLPNYIGATSGATQGIGDDGSPAVYPLTVDNLFRQVRAAGGTERSYQENMTQPCQQSSSGEYAVKHNPAAYYLGPGGQDRTACQSDDVAFPNWNRDLALGQLPTFAFVTPNLCHDTHDCPVSAGDAWLAAMLPPLLASPPYRDGTTAIFVIWDEDIPTANIEIAPAVHPGTVVRAPVDHFALLRTTEEVLGLPGRLGAAGGAPSLRPLLHL